MKETFLLTFCARKSTIFEVFIFNYLKIIKAILLIVPADRSTFAQRGV